MILQEIYSIDYTCDPPARMMKYHKGFILLGYWHTNIRRTGDQWAIRQLMQDHDSRNRG